MLKRSILLVADPTLTHQQFDHHRNTYADVFSSLHEVKANVRRYVQCHSTGDQLPAFPTRRSTAPPNSGSTPRGIAAVLGSDAYMRTIRPDKEKFRDLHACEFLIGTEHTVIG